MRADAPVLLEGTHQEALKILVVEDDPTVSEVMSRYLEKAGFEVVAVEDGLSGIEKARNLHPALVLLDLNLPGMDGIDVFRSIRRDSDVPVVMLTARGDEEDRVAGLEEGADDYVTKPFSPREVVLRIGSVLRRSPSVRDLEVTRVSTFGDLIVNIAAREVRKAGNAVELTAREFDLLAFLCARPGEVFRREQLLEEVWGWRFGDTATVTVHIRRVREKIEDDPSQPVHIATVWGVGYRFDG